MTTPLFGYSTLIELTLTPREAWAIGAFTGLTADAVDDEGTTRLPVVRTAEGAAYLPATSLAGSLREHLGDRAARWLGELKDGTTTPSRLRLLAATLTGDAAVATRTTTAISAERRAAEVSTLRTAEHLPPQGSIVWRMIWDQEAQDPAELAELIKRLKTWHPVLGRSRSTGQGQAELTAIRHWTCDRSRADHLTWWLTQRGDLLTGGDTASPPSGGWHEVTPVAYQAPEPVIHVDFEVVDALHLGTGHVDGNELMTAEEVAATSWKGIFRHRVRHILTVTGDPNAAATVARLFGSTRDEKSGLPGGRGILRFTASPVTPATGVDGRARVQRITQVGIDRISGGALMNTKDDPRTSHGSLYTVQYLPPGSRLRLEIHASEPLDVREAALLEWVLQDLREGIIGVGGMTTRGFGTLKEMTS